MCLKHRHAKSRNIKDLYKSHFKQDRHISAAKQVPHAFRELDLRIVEKFMADKVAYLPRNVYCYGAKICYEFWEFLTIKMISSVRQRDTENDY